MASKRKEPKAGQRIFSFVHNNQFYVCHDHQVRMKSVDYGYSEDQLLPLQRFDFSSAQWSGVYPKSEVQKQFGFNRQDFPGDVGMCCAVLGDCAYMFGGLRWANGYAVHELNLETMVRRKLEPKNREDGPIHKDGAGMVACGSGALCVFGGYGPDIGRHQPGAIYRTDRHLPFYGRHKCLTNELHLFHIGTGTWSSPETTGPQPPPCVHITFTKVDHLRAVLLGGGIGYHGLKEMHILDMEHWNWSGVVSPCSPTDLRPRGRFGPNACVLFDPAPTYASESSSIKAPHSSSFGVHCNPQLLVLWSEGIARHQIWIFDVNSITWIPVGPPPLRENLYTDYALGCHNRSRTEVEIVIYGGCHYERRTTLLYLGLKTLYHSCVDYVAKKYKSYQLLVQQLLPPHIQMDIGRERDKRAHYQVAQL